MLTFYKILMKILLYYKSLLILNIHIYIQCIWTFIDEDMYYKITFATHHDIFHIYIGYDQLIFIHLVLLVHL